MTRACILLLFLLAVAAAGGLGLGQRALALQSPALPDTLQYPQTGYTALVEGLSASLWPSLSRGGGPQERLRAFSSLTRHLHATATQEDILALDLRAGRLDCTSLAILMYDVWQSHGDSLAFVVRERHVFITDGTFDYDPLQVRCEPSARRWPSAMEVVGGPELMLSLSERAMGEWLGSSRLDEATEWFARALRRQPADPLTLVVWGWQAHQAGQDDTAEQKLRQCALLWPDAAHSNYALGRFLAEAGRYDEARWYLEVAQGLAVHEQDERLKRTIEKLLLQLPKND